NDKVTLVNTMTNEKLDRQGVVAKFGVPPERIVDYLAIIGDSVDNVPGVHKAGPKTANKWLAEYGDLDQLIAHASEIKGVVGDNLRASLDWLPKARELLTVKLDCDLNPHISSLHDLHAKPEDPSQLRALFERYAFKSWLKELDAKSPSTLTSQSATNHSDSSLQKSQPQPLPQLQSQGEIDRDYVCVTTREAFLEWLEQIKHAKLTCIDTETTSLDALQAELVGISLSVEEGKACYIPVAHRTGEEQLERDWVLAQMKPWLEDPLAKKLGQNLKYDMHVFGNYQIQVQGVEHDTLLESYVLESHLSHSMDNLAQRHLGIKTIQYEEVCGKGVHQIGFDQVDLKTATEYAAEDADITLRLHHHLWPQLERMPSLRYVYEQIEMPAMRVLGIMESNGITIDREKLAIQGQEV
ncbi:MAG: DNA polymerase I, partial [Burkholderiaceae bacterium]|nr:DNA polymerase I [Burkholderiaceae bacterium]